MTRRLPRGGVVKTSDGIFVSSDGIFFPSDGIFVPSAVMPASIPLALGKDSASRMQRARSMLRRSLFSRLNLDSNAKLRHSVLPSGQTWSTVVENGQLWSKVDENIKFRGEKFANFKKNSYFCIGKLERVEYDIYRAKNIHCS